MNLIDMRTIVRRDLHDEDASGYRWTNDELDRHIMHAVKDYSEAIPYEQKATKATTSGSREIDITNLSDRIMIEEVEYPIGNFPPQYQRFSVLGNIVTVLGNVVPDGSNIYVYYGKLHTLDVNSCTINPQHEDLIATSACGYVAVEMAIFTVNRVNVGGMNTANDLLAWGHERFDLFRREIKRLGRKNKVRARSLFRPFVRPVSKSVDYGP